MAKVGNSEAVEKIFGSWPSFHDAEVVQIRLDRGGRLDPNSSQESRR
jgi:hypothetical protein